MFDYFVISTHVTHETAKPHHLIMVHASTGDYGYGFCSPQVASHPRVSADTPEEVVRLAGMEGYQIAADVPADVQTAIVALKDLGHLTSPILVRERKERDFEVRIADGQVLIFEADDMHSHPGQYAGWIKASSQNEARSLARRSDFIASVLENWLNQEK